MNGFREELTSKILGINGHLKVQSIYSSGMKIDEEFKRSITNKTNKILTHEIVSGNGLLSYKNYSNGILIKGVDVNYFEERKIFKKKINKESLLRFKNNEGILLGNKLRKKLKIKTGDYITILSAKSYETFLGNVPRTASFKVVGFFDVGMYEYDTSLVFMPIEILQKFLNYEKKIDYYEIVIDDFEKLSQVKEDINNISPKYYRVIDWRELNPSLFNAIEVERNVMFIILMMIIIVAAFNLISSLMILVSTKKKDIGILRVLGVSKPQLLKIFIINGFLIGLFGTILGLLIGLIFCFNINEIRSFVEFLIGSNLFSEEIYFFFKPPNYY